MPETLHDELEAIDREYRRKVLLACIACALGVSWGLAKIAGVVMKHPPSF